MNKGRPSYTWVNARKSDPCFVCGRPNWCGRACDDNGRVRRLLCRKTSSHPLYGQGDQRSDKDGRAYYIFRPRHSDGSFEAFGSRPFADPDAAPRPKSKRKVTNAVFSPNSYGIGLTAARARLLGQSLKLPASAVTVTGVGFDLAVGAEGVYTFAERDGAGRVIGFHHRFLDGTKKHKAGTSRGLFVPDEWEQFGGPLYLVEGASDALAMAAAGLASIGRPSNLGGVVFLKELLARVPAERFIVVVGENDRKANGDWPGRHGAYVTATSLAAGLGRSVQWAMVPKGAKDVREWLTARVEPKNPRSEWERAGKELAEALSGNATTSEPGWPQLTEFEAESFYCPRPHRVTLIGKPNGRKAGVNATEDFPCRCWHCPACQRQKGNRLLSWFYRCIVQWTDPDRMHSHVERVELAPDGMATGERGGGPSGPWTLHGAIMDERTWATTSKNLDKKNASVGVVEFLRVKVPPEWEPSIPRIGERAQQELLSDETRSFVLVALAPGVSSPRVCVPLSPDEAIRGLQDAFAAIPYHPSYGERKRFRPINQSRGWTMPERATSDLFTREGRSVYSVELVKKLVVTLGGVAGDNLFSPQIAQDGTSWLEKAIGGELVAFTVRQLLDSYHTGGRKLTEDELNRRACAWQNFIRDGQFPDCSEVRYEIRSRLTHEPTGDDREAILDAVARDGAESPLVGPKPHISNSPCPVFAP